MPNSQRHGVGPRNPAPLHPAPKPVPPSLIVFDDKPGVRIDNPVKVGNEWYPSFMVEPIRAEARRELLQELIAESGELDVIVNGYQFRLATWLTNHLESEEDEQ